MTVAGVLLAAGAGSRFLDGGGQAVAGHKLTAPFRGRPVVAWALLAAHEAGFNRLYVISGAVDLTELVAETLGPKTAEANPEANRDSGTPAPNPAAPNRAGPNAAEPTVLDSTTDYPAPGTPVTVVHNPRWAEGQATSLHLAAQVAEEHGHRAIVVGLGDQPLVPASAWRSVGAAAGEIVTATFDGQRRPPVKLERSVWGDLPDSGDQGARSLFRMRPELVSELPCNGNPVDIDTLEDLQQWS